MKNVENLVKIESGLLPKAKKLSQYFAAFSGNLGAFSIGTSFYYTATALPDMKRKDFQNLTESEENWITAVLFFGTLFSSPIAGFGVEKFGRRSCLLILTLPFVLGWLLIAFADSLFLIYCGRFLTGICAGSYGTILPIFMAEISEVSIRGRLTCLYELMLTAGGLYIYIIGAYTSWKIQAIACAIVPVICHLLVLIIPESPRFLIEQKKSVQAAEALCWYRGAESLRDVEKEFLELQLSVDKSRAGKLGWHALKDPAIIRVLLMGLGLMSFLKLSFIDPIEANVVQIFQTAGCYDEYMSTIIIGLTSMLVTIVPILLVDKCGRRLLLLLSLMFVSLSIASLGFYFHLKNLYGEYMVLHYSWMPIVSLMGYVIACALGIAPLPWVIIGETVPTNAKGIASGILVLWTRIMGFAVVYFFRSLFKAFGKDGGYYFIAATCALGFVFVYFFVPETKGKTLDEIQSDLK